MSLSNLNIEVNVNHKTVGELRQEFNKLEESVKKLNNASPQWDVENEKLAKYGKALTEAGTTGLGVYSTLLGIGGTAARFAGPIGVIVGSIGLLLDVLLESANTTGIVSENTDDYVDALDRLQVAGKRRRNQEHDLLLLLARQQELREELRKPIPAHAKQLTVDQEALYRTLQQPETVFKDPNEELEFIQEMIERLVKTLRLKEDILTVSSRITEEVLKQAELPEIVITGKGSPLKPLESWPKVTPDKLSRVPGGGGMTMADVAKSIDVTFTDLLRTSGAFASAFESGMQGVGSAIQRSLGTAFERVFGEANSLLEQFIKFYLERIRFRAIVHLLPYRIFEFETQRVEIHQNGAFFCFGLQ
ncbi:MAG TPA: hypothetical protein VII11_00355 [Bacteroidota bacterium]